MSAVMKTEQLPVVAEGTTLLAVIARAAADPGTDVEKMERLMAMYERIDAKRAETAFNEAMNDCQSKMGRISADALNPQTRSNYATYGKLDKVVRPIYTEGGFALSFDTADAPHPDYVRVVCHVSHKGGHTRSYHTDMPADGKGAKGGDVMTKTHAAGSAMTYGMRYLLKMIFNIAIGEEDNDGNGGPNPVVLDWMSKIDEQIDLPTLKQMSSEIAKLSVSGRDKELIRKKYMARKAELEKVAK